MSMLQGSFLIIGASEKNLRTLLPKIIGPDISLENNPDVVQIKTDDSSLGIEDIRGLQKRLALKPTSSPCKIALIYEAEKLTPEAQNALLKTLEEPPGNAIILLLATSDDFFLPTILSRCQIISFSLESPILTDKEIKRITQHIETLSKGSTGQKLKAASEIASSRQDAINFLDNLLNYAHQQLISDTSTCSPEQIKAIFETKKFLQANSNVRLAIENLFINW